MAARRRGTVRQRSRASGDALDPVVHTFLAEHFDGDFPDDPVQALSFIENHFSEAAYRQHRHMLMDRLLRRGLGVPEIAVMFNKTERTIWRWKQEMTEWFAEAFTLMDVRQIHVERMRDFAQMRAALDEVLHSKTATPGEILEASRAKVRVHAMEDQVLRQAGYYRVFDVDKMRPEDAEGVADTDEFLTEMENALLPSPGAD